MEHSQLPQWTCLFLATLVVFLLPISNLYAQGMMGGSQSCPMCGSMGWGGMILGALLILSIIAVLVALSIYLFRKSRGPQH